MSTSSSRGRRNRERGREGELEVLKRLNAIGGDGVLNYGQEELSGADGDVQTNYGQFECKRRAAFPSWMTLSESVRGCYVRRDRGEWMVLVRAYDYETLLASHREAAREKYGPSSFPTAEPIEED